MADRYAFQSPFSRGEGSDPWFKVGSVAVTTTVAITALGVFGILMVALEGGIGPILGALVLDPSAITGGQVWRLISWPIPPEDDFFWALLGILFFYMVGSQFESMLGRRAFFGFVVALVVAPATLGMLAAVVDDDAFLRPGLSLLFLGVAVGFSAAFTQARSFFGIPFWALVAFIFVIRLLGVVANRDLPGLVMLATTGVVGLVLTKSLGFAPSIEWIPTVPLPASMTGAAPTTTTRAPVRKRQKRKRGTRLRAVPDQASASEAEIDALLDQVNDRGLDSLSKQQKGTLERHAKEMRKRRDQS